METETKDFNELVPPMVPKFDVPKEFKDSFSYLKYLVNKGAERYLTHPDEYREVPTERLEKELEIIQMYHFEDFYLIWWDLVQYCKKNKIIYFNQSSAICTSLVLYCLEITYVNPIDKRHFIHLDFERFIYMGHVLGNYDRNFDMYVSSDTVTILYNYLKSKYGANRVNIVGDAFKNKMSVLITDEPISTYDINIKKDTVEKIRDLEYTVIKFHSFKSSRYGSQILNNGVDWNLIPFDDEEAMDFIDYSEEIEYPYYIEWTIFRYKLEYLYAHSKDK